MENTMFDFYFEKSDNGEYKDPLLFILEELWKAAEENGKTLSPYIKASEFEIRQDFEKLGRTQIQRCIALMELRACSPSTVSLKFAQEMVDKSGLLDILFDKI